MPHQPRNPNAPKYFPGYSTGKDGMTRQPIIASADPRRQCGYCVHATGSSESLDRLWCEVWLRLVPREATCDHYLREPGADDE